MVTIMQRRRFLQTGSVLLTMLGLATMARANEPAAAPAPAAFDMAGVGLPIIVGGRVRNYVFIALKLHLGAGYALEAVRAKEPYLRDALVRAGHATPFVLADDWTRLDEAALSASVIRSAARLIGPGAVTRVEIVSQAARRRAGVRGA